MNREELCQFLLWSLAINFGILLIWFIAFVAGRDWMYSLHARQFKLSESTFDAIHYGGMAIYKIGIILFVLVPLLVLWLTGGG